MKHILSIFFSFSLSCQVFSCEIVLPHRLLLNKAITSGVTVEDIFLKSSCESNIEKQVMDLILSSNGTLDNKTVSNSLGLANLKITPTSTQVVPISELIMNSLNIPDNKKIDKLAYLDNTKVIKMNNNEEASIDCENCNKNQNNRLKILISNIQTGKQDIIHAKFNLLDRIKVLSLTNNIPLGQKDDLASIVNEEWIYSDEPLKYFTDKRQLKYYKNVHPLKKGHQLLQTDLTKKRLVHLGHLSKLIIKHKNLTLKSRARSKQNGNLGDVITLTNTKTNKIITGKVIDYNTVEVSL